VNQYTDERSALTVRGRLTVLRRLFNYIHLLQTKIEEIRS